MWVSSAWAPCQRFAVLWKVKFTVLIWWELFEHIHFSICLGLSPWLWLIHYRQRVVCCLVGAEEIVNDVLMVFLLLLVFFFFVRRNRRIWSLRKWKHCRSWFGHWWILRCGCACAGFCKFLKCLVAELNC